MPCGNDPARGVSGGWVSRGRSRSSGARAAGSGSVEPVSWDTWHVIPLHAGEPQHEESAACFCEPERLVNYTTGVECWSHRRSQ